MTTIELAKGTYAIDASHSEIGFQVRHLGISSVKGSFGALEGTVQAGGSLAALSASASIQAASIDTRNTDRDNHLRSADFFDAEKHPALQFKSNGVVDKGNGEFTMAGTLTIRGVAKPIELKGEFQGSAKDPWGNEKVAFTASGKLNRTDYGLNWNAVLEAGGLLVSEEVKLVLDVQAVKQA
ncbi:MAG: YceI family protein [Rhodothermales bacterium]|nr:YceI family protein [Rhodothermales bacterium]